MTDRELLKLAAKAAGLKNPEYAPAVAGNWNIYHGDDPHDQRECWNPLTDNGDALRLMAKLNMHLDYTGRGHQFTGNAVAMCGPNIFVAEPKNGDVEAATRRAIVRAAAEIGRQMQKSNQHVDTKQTQAHNSN